MSELGQIQGEAGQIEYLFEKRASQVGLVLSHPHPLYGGSMLDGVLQTIDQAVSATDISTIRYNFRGVGASQGEFDHGEGEIQDLGSICEKFKHDFEDMYLGGYSFGALVTLNYAKRRDFDGKLVLVAPPTTVQLPSMSAETHVIVGDSDHISDMNVLNEWQQGNRSVTLHVLDEADHFLAGYSSDIQQIVREIFG